MNRWSALALLAAVLVALALRVPKLGARPLHNDEAVNAVKVVELWQEGRYVYDPDEYHGPTLHYFTLPFLWLSGVADEDELDYDILRLAPLAFGAGLILLLPLFLGGMGRHAVSWSALFIAVSPAMVFYSRYFIHEMLLVFFTALTLGAGWRYSQTQKAGWAAAAGAGLGLMFATKETFVLTAAAMGFGALAVLCMSKRNARFWEVCSFKHASLALGAAIAVWALFFSSFFTHPAGLPDSILTYLPWLKRAGGESPHIHEWSFYLERLAWFHSDKGPAWSEGLILFLALAGMAASFVGTPRPLHRFLSIYTLALTAVYCAISYKTPWCLLSFFHGMILLAGIGAAALVNRCRSRGGKTAVFLLILGFTFQLTWQSWRAGFEYAADRRNPYVYAQTSPDIMNLVKTVEGVAQIASEGYETVVKVIAPQSDYWPLPWFFRRFEYIGWYEALPEDPFAPIVAVSADLGARLDDQSERKWVMVGLFELRPGKFFELYVELELWKLYVETLPRPVD